MCRRFMVLMISVHCDAHLALALVVVPMHTPLSRSVRSLWRFASIMTGRCLVDSGICALVTKWTSAGLLMVCLYLDVDVAACIHMIVFPGSV